MHQGLDLHNSMTTSGTKGPPLYSMCHGRFTTGSDPHGAGKIVSLELKFPDGTPGQISHFHNHSYNSMLKDGQFVFAGELLAYSGDTGNAVGNPNSSGVTSKHAHTELIIFEKVAGSSKMKKIHKNPATIFLSDLEAEPSTDDPDDQSLQDYRIEVHPKIQGRIRQTNSEGGTSPLGGVLVEVCDGENDSIVYSKTLTDKHGNYTAPAPPGQLTVVFKQDGKEKKRVEATIKLKADAQTIEKLNVDDF